MRMGEESATTLCNAWLVKRQDGEIFGFTDHDEDLTVEGVVCQAGSGLSGAAVQKSLGLSVDNSETSGALTADFLRTEDINAGRYDHAVVDAYQINWESGETVDHLFSGTVGEIRQEDGAFHAELRGLAEAFNQPLGRIYQPNCDAVLGDKRCGVDITDPALSGTFTVDVLDGQRQLLLSGGDSYPSGWFLRGVLRVLDGDAKGLMVQVKHDLVTDGRRSIELWFQPGSQINVGDTVQLTAGCDGTIGQCAQKFSNIEQFRGFPTIPGDDWKTAFPSSNTVNDGGRHR